MLSEQEEALLAEASEALSSPSNTFSVLNNADITFPSIKDENGKETQITHGNFINFLESSNREVRKTHLKPYIKHTDSIKTRWRLHSAAL